ncbi:MAG: quinoprotein dehydrogenase-associated putative ABC transporter substrate-binding protein [Rhodospirillaceae bacterium]
MSSRCLERIAAVLIVAAALASGACGARELRVCADPDNLPYSRRDGAGFENQIAVVLARALDATPTFVWVPQGRGYVRKTLNAGLCDVVMGVPAHYDPVRATRPYYRSTYVAVTRAGQYAFRDFDDPALRQLPIGVQLVGDDLAATPPGHALAQRGLIDNVRGYTIYGEGRQGERMVRDVARGDIAVALLWGPQGAYFAAHEAQPLDVYVVRQPPDLPDVPFEYAIAVGVRKSDVELQRELDAALERSQPAIDAILRAYNVPRTDRQLARDGAAAHYAGAWQ